ncbi:NUDIX hydrolase [Candidatus Hydrogenedentota bacterium]
MSDFEVLERKLIHSGRVLDLFVEEVRLPTGRAASREIIRHEGSAAIVPILDDGRVIMVRQFRCAVGGYMLEIPAGTIEKGEKPATCARRELEEEIGYSARSIDLVTRFYTSPGFLDEEMFVYVARGLTPCAQCTEDDEVIDVVVLSRGNVLAKIRNGEIADAKTIAGILMVLGEFS